jgi:hypothetical protein
MGKLVWLHREDDDEPWVIRDEREKWRGGQWRRIFYFDVEE